MWFMEWTVHSQEGDVVDQFVQWVSGVPFDMSSMNTSRPKKGFCQLHEKPKVTNNRMSNRQIKAGIHGLAYRKGIEVENTLRYFTVMRQSKEKGPKHASSFTSDTIMSISA